MWELNWSQELLDAKITVINPQLNKIKAYVLPSLFP